MAQVHDFWLLRGVEQLRAAFCQRGGHYQILGGADGDLGKGDFGPVQPVLAAPGGLGKDIAVSQLDPGAERLQPHEVQVDRARADGATARQADFRPAHTRHQWAKNQDRRPHLADQLIGRADRGDVRSVQAQGRQVVARGPAARLTGDG